MRKNLDFLASSFSYAGSAFVRCLWVLVACAFLAATATAADSYLNPIIANGADPWVVQKDGFYYYTQTTGLDVKVRKAAQITGSNGLSSATAVTVFTPPSPNNQEVWAPELHFLNGKWYIYYAADDGTNANHRIYVAEANTSNPQGSYTFKGKIYDAANDRWAIDGTVLQKDDGSLYFIWSGWPGTTDGKQNLYIAPMSNPWTISGPRVVIGTTHYTWEYPASWGAWLQEGPEVLKHNGKTFIVFSANGSWTDDYCLGLLVNTNGNFTNAASWTKLSTPVFKRYSDLNGAIDGPGHCSFTKSLDGTEDFILYHAAKYSGAGWDRNVRTQRFSWNADDTPNFDTPIPTTIPLTSPSGERPAPTSTTLYTLTLNPGPGGIARVPEQLRYKPGTVVTLTGYDNQEIHFTGWSSDVWKTNASVAVIMDRNKTATANYSYPLSVMDNPSATFSNTWTLSSVSSQRFGSNYNYAFTSNVVTHTATFRPDIAATGKYDLYVYYSDGSNRSTRSPWLISSLDGSNTVSINQQLNGGTWQSLGTGIRFAQGTNGFVQLANNTGEAGKVVIADAVLFIYSAYQDAFPKIYAQPLSQTVPLGSAVTLSVGALGNPGYQWQFQNQNLAGATSASLVISNFSAQNEGDYRVVLSNGLGSVTSSNALLRLNAPLRLGFFARQASGVSQLQIVGSMGSNYVLEVSGNLKDWTPVETNLVINGLWNATNNGGTNSSRQFYRAVAR